MLVNSEMISLKEMVNYIILIMIFMKDSTKMERNMVMEFIKKVMAKL